MHQDVTGYDGRGNKQPVLKMLTAWTSFNEAALKDMYIHGLPQLKVYSQTSSLWDWPAGKQLFTI